MRSNSQLLSDACTSALLRRASFDAPKLGRYAPRAASTGISSEAKDRKDMTLKRMDNVLIVVDDLEATKAFFIELGLTLEGETIVEVLRSRA